MVCSLILIFKSHPLLLFNSSTTLVVIFVGATLMTFSVVNFIVQHDMANAGFTGIKIIVHQLTGMNPGLVGYLMNIPMLIIFYKHYDKQTFFLTIYGMAVFNGTLWLFSEIGPIVPKMSEQMLLMAIICGLIGGVGVGMVARVNGTTGGSFIVGKLANTFLNISIAKALLIFDAGIILLSLFLFLTPLNFLYTMLSIFVMSLATAQVEKFRKVSVT